MPFHLKKCVVLVGMMGAGKSAVGLALAKHLQVPFLDSDSEIESAANRTIAEIFERDGEAFFRLKESQVLKRLLIDHTGILSTGGGAFMKKRNRRAISDYGVSVWLDADVDVLWSRVRHKTSRPLLRTNDPRATLEALYRDRTPKYAKADLTVRTEASFSIEQTMARVIDTLLTRPDVLEEVQ